MDLGVADGGKQQATAWLFLPSTQACQACQARAPHGRGGVNWKSRGGPHDRDRGGRSSGLVRRYGPLECASLGSQPGALVPSRVWWAGGKWAVGRGYIVHSKRGQAGGKFQARSMAHDQCCARLLGMLAQVAMSSQPSSLEKCAQSTLGARWAMGTESGLGQDGLQPAVGCMDRFEVGWFRQRLPSPGKIVSTGRPSQQPTIRVSRY